MASDFVVTEKRVNTVIDGVGPGYTLMSVIPYGGDCVDITIGAKRKNRCGPSFCKETLRELIQILEEIHEAM